MRDEYTIHEIAALYGVSADALRYYERLGLIRPRRAPNGYRLYSLRDIYRLTILRDLRELGFSMERIGQYLRGLSVENTLALLGEEEALVRRQLRRLRQSERAIRARARMLAASRDCAVGEVAFEQLCARPCVRLNADITRDEEMDFAIKKLHLRHADAISDLGGRQIGACMRLEDVRSGAVGRYRSVFILLRPGDGEGDLVLPAGRYARLFYRGSYRRLAGQAEALLAQVSARGLRPRGDVLEIYHVDNRYTAREEEFLTELQVALEP